MRLFPARAAAILGSALLAAATIASAAARAETIVVAELYTSQGCNSCPPADALLGKLAERDDVVALSFHIDYWDYLGWRDRFAKPEHTARQHAYKSAMRIRAVYTPQLILQGQEGLVGHHADKIANAIAARKTDGVRANVAATREANAIRVAVSPAGGPLDGPADVWAFGYDGPHDIVIERGENAGKTLTYHNVVRTMRRVAVWDGRTEQSFAFAPEGPAGLDYAIVVQSGDGSDDRKIGPILGAAVAR